jgi:hypothetical protein
MMCGLLLSALVLFTCCLGAAQAFALPTMADFFSTAPVAARAATDDEVRPFYMWSPAASVFPGTTAAEPQSVVQDFMSPREAGAMMGELLRLADVSAVVFYVLPDSAAADQTSADALSSVLDASGSSVAFPYGEARSFASGASGDSVDVQVSAWDFISMAAYEHDEQTQSWDIVVDGVENQCEAAIEALERALEADSGSSAQEGLSVVRLIFAAEAMECMQHIDTHVSLSSAPHMSTVSVTQYFSYFSSTSTGLTAASGEQEGKGESEQATATISTPAAPHKTKTFQEALAEYATTQHKGHKNTHAVKRRLATVRGLLASPASKGSLSVAGTKANVVYVTPTIVVALLIFVPLLIFFACASTWTMGIRVPPRLTTTRYYIGKES